MDLSTVANGVSAAASGASGLASSVDLSVLKSIQDLQAVLASELFGSLGIGSTVDAFA